MMGTTGILVIGLALGGGGAGADATVLIRAVEVEVDTAQAAALEREAEALFSRPDQWRRAAVLLERAADLRPVSDPQRTQDLMIAGQIQGHLRNAARAERLLTLAAEEAHARGALLDAARAYLSAADFAIQRSEHRRASALVGRAELLSDSPHLSRAEQASIKARLPVVRTG